MEGRLISVSFQCDVGDVHDFGGSSIGGYFQTSCQEHSEFEYFKCNVRLHGESTLRILTGDCPVEIDLKLALITEWGHAGMTWPMAAYPNGQE